MIFQEYYFFKPKLPLRSTLPYQVQLRIYEKTKIKINYVTPALDDGAQLSTMISGNKLPDVITVGAGSEEATQLATEGYAYPIQTLA